MKTSQNAVAAGHSGDPAAWWQVFEDVLARISARFVRSETRQTVRDLLMGLVSQVERKNGWWLAEHAGHDTPHRMRRLLRAAVWDHERVAEDLRDLVVEQFGHPDAVLVVDETLRLFSRGAEWQADPAPHRHSRSRPRTKGHHLTK